MTTAATGFAAVLLAAPASAYFAPTLGSISFVSGRHASATFQASGADDAVIYFANKPDRATDGRFFDENVKETDFLTPEEVQNGRWLSEAQLAPGMYYVMLRASCYRFDDTNCADGFSNVLTLNVPLPPVSYTTKISSVFRGISVYAGIRASALGQSKPYRVCYTSRTRTQRCVNRVIAGYSWDESASDDVRFGVSAAMPTLTTFTWWVDGRVLSRKTVRVR